MNTRLFKKGDIIQRGDYKYIVAKGTTPDYMIYEKYPGGRAQGGIPMDKALIEFTLVTPRESHKQLKARIAAMESHIKALETRLCKMTLEKVESDKAVRIVAALERLEYGAINHSSECWSVTNGLIVMTQVAYTTLEKALAAAGLLSVKTEPLHKPGSNPHDVDEFYPKDAENNSA
jgi:hypothetical protein